MNQWELKATARNRGEARENARDQIVIASSFASHGRNWLVAGEIVKDPVKQNQSSSDHFNTTPV